MADKRVFPGSQTDGSLTLIPLPSLFAWGRGGASVVRGADADTGAAFGASRAFEILA
jgi:hypothetical protein